MPTKICDEFTELGNNTALCISPRGSGALLRIVRRDEDGFARLAPSQRALEQVLGEDIPAEGIHSSHVRMSIDEIKRQLIQHVLAA